MSKKGFSLIEVLVTLGILGIFTGIATVSYQGYVLDVTKRTLKDSGTLFQMAVNTCIKRKNGGLWMIKRYTQGTETCTEGKPEPCIEMTPCRVPKTGRRIGGDNAKNALKDILNFTCPVETKNKEGCQVYVNDNNKYFCLSIKKISSGKKLQVITIVSQDDPSDYEIWCGEPPGVFLTVQADENCKIQTAVPPRFTSTELKKDCPDWK